MSTPRTTVILPNPHASREERIAMWNSLPKSARRTQLKALYGNRASARGLMVAEALRTSRADEPEPTPEPTATTFTEIKIDRLQYQHIRLRSDSTVGIVTRESMSGVWIGLLVDGRFLPLVKWAHTVGREYLHASVEAACTQVQDAITSLTPATPEPVAVAFDSDALIAEAHYPDGSPRWALPTVIQIATILDRLCESVDAARAATNDSRWLNAIDCAWGWLLAQDAVSYDAATHALTIPSATRPGTVYTANGACQCEAFEKHTACWHRAAARLVQNAVTK